MKKMTLMALLVLGATSAFAGDSPALKNILKAKTYVEAESLVNSSLGELTDNGEKAKAYNKLVELAMEKYLKESTIKTENEVLKQNKEFDEAGMNEAAYHAVLAAMECDKYDQLPNEKGKVSPKFADKNGQRVWPARLLLVNAGQDALTNKDHATAKKYWGAFVDSDSAPLFAKCDRSVQQPFFAQVARFVGVFHYQDKELDKALKYSEIAMKDTAEYDNALNLKLTVLSDDLKNRADSLKFLDSVKAMYEENPQNSSLLERVYNLNNALGNKEAAIKVLDDALAANPNNFVALADKGIALLNEKPAEAVSMLKRAFELKPDNALIVTYLATGLSIQAQDITDKAKRNELYGEAVKYFDKAKELDPDKNMSNWGYNRYNAYYNLYGENDPRTKAAEAEK